MLRSRDLAPRRRMFCGASKAGFSNDDGSGAMIADITLNATSWRRTGRSPTALLSSQSLPHALFSTRGLFACSALNARSNDCHVGLLGMTQRAQYRMYTWACTLCVVLRTDFSCCPVHFQATKLNCCERCSRVPVGADPLRVTAPVTGRATAAGAWRGGRRGAPRPRRGMRMGARPAALTLYSCTVRSRL